MNLEAFITQYIVYRGALGEKLQNSRMYLKGFCKAVGPTITLNSITDEMITKFLNGASPSITPVWFNKYKALNGFYKYLLARNYVTKIPLPKILPKKPLPSAPYIYSNEELKNIFKSALNYKILKSHNSPYTVRGILVLTYALGLRIHETLSIKLGDIDVENSVITINESKFYKSRFVPFGQDIKEFMDEYLCWRIKQMQSQSLDSPLFIGKNNLQFKGRTLNDIFQKIRKIAGIKRNDHANFQPRIHDLRHTFAVNVLTGWYHEKKDVQNMLPILSTYLGHNSVAHTTVYLTMTDNLLQEASIRFEKYVKGESF